MKYGLTIRDWLKLEAYHLERFLQYKFNKCVYCGGKNPDWRGQIEGWFFKGIKEKPIFKLWVEKPYSHWSCAKFRLDLIEVEYAT